jgi:outer membrane protein assembly factor BamB
MTESDPPPQEPTSRVAGLRIWPLVVLLLVMWVSRIGVILYGEASIAAMMIRFMVPLICAALIVLWWLFFSRAFVKEKLIGLISLAVIIFLTTMLSHQTVKGFGTMLFAIPCGITAFAVALIVTRSRPPMTRTSLALIAALLGFGYWSLVRTDEILGDFDSQQSWRWQPSAEEQFLAERAARASQPSVDPAEQPLGDPQWPGFRGADRRGEQPGVVLEEDWSESPPKEIWRVRVGPGWSSFTVAGDRLFTQEQRGEQEVVVCYNAIDGGELWVHLDESRFFEVFGGTGPRATPTLSGGKLFTLGANGLLNCLDPLTGDLVWQRDIRDDADRDPPIWAFASSPLVTHGVVIVHAGGADDKGLLAYDEQSGELRWTAAAGNDSYSSPQLSQIDGKECVLMLTNTGVVFVEPSDGSVLGEHEWLFPGYRVVQPLVVDAASVLIGTPMGTGTQRVDVRWDGEGFDTEERWTTIAMSPYFNDYVAHEGFLYGIDKNIFACVDLRDGERKWKRGRYGNGQVLLLPSGGQLLVTTEKGELVLLRATPDKHVELARHRVFEARTWNHPVLVGNRLYVRNGEEAVCLEMAVTPTSGPAEEASTPAPEEASTPAPEEASTPAADAAGK